MLRLPKFGGNPRLFWPVAAVLAVFAWGMADTVAQWLSREGAYVAAFDAVCLLIILVLYNPAAFRWAGRILAAGVFLAYSAYLGAELTGRFPAPTNAPVSWRWALVGYAVYGMPALYFIIFGRLPLFGGVFARVPHEEEAEPLDDSGHREQDDAQGGGPNSV